MLNAFEVDQRARRCFVNSLPPEWSASPPVDDVGLDYWVQITDRGKPTGISFFVQLKGTQFPEQVQDKLAHSLRTDRLFQYLSSGLPVLFVLCHVSEPSAESDAAFYCWLREFAQENLAAKKGLYEQWMSQKTTTITIRRTQVLSSDACTKHLLPYLQNFRRRHNAQEDHYIDYLKRINPVTATKNVIQDYFQTSGVDYNSEDAILVNKYWLAGLMLQETGKHAEAVDCFRRAQSVIPTPLASIALGVSCDVLGLHDEAIASVNEGLRLAPFDPYLWANKGTLLFRFGQFQEALACHEHAVKLCPDDAYLWACAGATLEFMGSDVQINMQILDRALGFYQRARELRPDDDYILTEMGLVLSKLYAFKRAAVVLERAVVLNPANPVAWKRLCRACIMNQDYERGREAFNQVHRLGAATKEIQRLGQFQGWEYDG